MIIQIEINLTNIFRMGWNRQLDNNVPNDFLPPKKTAWLNFQPGCGTSSEERSTSDELRNE